MLRRLYFLFPDEIHAQRVVNQLLNLNIPIQRMHAIAPNVELLTLPKASKNQKNDVAYKMQRLLWNANLSLFTIALLALIVTLAIGTLYWSVFSLIVMIITFFAGQELVTHKSDTNLTKFTNALAHGEVLLMIDTPIYRVAEIEKLIHQQHPEATLGGTSWTIESYNL